MKSKNKLHPKKSLSFYYAFSVLSLPVYLIIVFILYKLLSTPSSNPNVWFPYVNESIITLLVVSPISIIGSYVAIKKIWADTPSIKRATGLTLAILAIAVEFYGLYYVLNGVTIQ